jgi:hypothetical protein
MSRYFGLSVVGLLLGVAFLPGGVVSAVTCSDISKYSQSTFSPCQQVGTWDDESQNRYSNNHSTDDVTLAFSITDIGSNVLEASGEPNIPYSEAVVQELSVSFVLPVRAKRDDQCSELAIYWTTRVSVGGNICTGTSHTFTFSTVCC